MYLSYFNYFRLGLLSGKVVTKKFANLETCVEIGILDYEILVHKGRQDLMKIPSKF